MARTSLISIAVLWCAFNCVFIYGKIDTTNSDDKLNGKDEEDVNTDTEEFSLRDADRGFGSDINWIPWPEAVDLAGKESKPLFLLIHKSWCGACQSLKRSFNSSTKRGEFVKLSKEFVMVNVDEDEPEDEMYAPDGRYIPRVFILRKDGTPLPIDNKENFPKNIAYFPQLPDVLKAMKDGLAMFKKEESDSSDQDQEDSSKGPKGPPKTEKGKLKEELNKGEKPKEKFETKEEGSAKKKEVKEKKSKDGEAKDNEVKGGCPHAAGKAAAKKKADEEAKKKKEQENKKMNDKAEKDGKKAAEKETKVKKEAKEDAKKAETSKKKKDTAKKSDKSEL